MNEAEQFAEDYLKRRVLRPKRFSKQEMRLTKTPDFRVFNGAVLVAYCEAKHVQEDDRLEKQLVDTPIGAIVGGVRQDPIFNRISNHIHEAAQQFSAVNPDRVCPNILVFANSDTHSDARDLDSVLTGLFRVKGGADEPIYKQYSEGRIQKEKHLIDLYIWWDTWKDAERYSRYFAAESPHKDKLKTMLPR